MLPDKEYLCLLLIDVSGDAALEVLQPADQQLHLIQKLFVCQQQLLCSGLQFRRKWF